MDRFWSKVDKTPGCWVWTRATRDGYGVFQLEAKKLVSAHRLSYEMTYGPIPVGALVRHKCDNPPCVRPEHLELGGYLENSADMVDRGRSKSALTNEQVIEARFRAGNGESIHSIAKDIPVDVHILASAIRGKTFSHLDGTCEPNFFKPLYKKLTEDQYVEIMAALEKPYHGQGRELAAKYGVDPSMITLIKKDKLKTIRRTSM